LDIVGHGRRTICFVPRTIVLVNLVIRDFTIVDRLELDLDTGLTALTGETGAGKSILVDALLLALGGRASGDAVRPGQRRAEITATFDTALAPALAERLKTLDLDTEDGDCIVRRVIGAEGRSRAFINGQPVPVQTLRDLGHGVIEVHGQHAHHSLLRPEYQRDLLDTLGGHANELDAVKKAYVRVGEIGARREQLLGEFEDRDARIGYVRFQLEELDELGLRADEIPALEADQRRLANAQEIVESCAALENALGGDERGDATATLRESLGQAQTLAGFDPTFEEVARSLNNALIEIEEAGRTVRAYAQSMEVSPQRLAEVEARMSRLHDLARKHRVTVEELPARTEALRDELTRLAGVEEELADLETELVKVHAAYDKAARALRKRREGTTPDLAKTVTGLLANLGMPKATFSVVIEALSHENDNDGEKSTAKTSPKKRTATGSDRVEFWVQTNAGHARSPLAKIASGGELSRISLALHVAGAARTGSTTLVFDEVDVGIGGTVASQVGQRLREVGESKQVLCITHLPQVAAFAHQHLRVEKRETKDQTVTALALLEGDERVEEIARMLGGIQITSRTLEHAREMLSLEATT
jgi:DNA repair protein RecN (Recombination protein N)